jgi:D-glycero-alpha-D-manno-heptose-7-phosphate kinase
MIITRTPFRISFFGGGTDYPGWFQEHGGAVISTSINKYCYVTCRYLLPFFEHRHRIVYSKVELVRQTGDIQHPAVRAVLELEHREKGLEIHYDGDLPAWSGLGTSSSFIVGLLHALSALKGQELSSVQLAKTAIHVEQNIMAENVGSQDQVSAAFGGFNRIEFMRNGEFKVEPVFVPDKRLIELQEHLMLFFTGGQRKATDVAKSQIANFRNRETELKHMYGMVDRSIKILQDESTPMHAFGELLDECWRYKRSLSNLVSTSKIDEVYAEAKKEGAIGGKLLGAGGGGFMLLFVPPEQQDAVRKRLHHLVHVRFKFEHSGSCVVLNQPDDL